MTTSGEFPRAAQLRLVGTNRDLVELFQLKSSSVLSNWRARRADFPNSLDSELRSGLYDLDAVLEWARSPDTPARLKPNPAFWWTRTVAAFWDQSGLAPDADGAAPSEGDEVVRSFLAAVVLLHAIGAGAVRGIEGPPLFDALRTASDPFAAMIEISRVVGQQELGLDGLLVSPLESGAVASPYLLDLVGRLDTAFAEGLEPITQLEIVLAPAANRAPGPSITTTDDVLAELVSSSAVIAGDGVLYDPCAGEGALVVACARKLPETRRVVVQEIDPDASRILRTRLLLSGLDAEVAEPGRSSIGEDQFPGLRADLVVADPPVTPKSPLVDWVDHVLAHLGANGVALLVLPVHALFEVKPARRVPETELIDRIQSLTRQGRVGSVTLLPVRLRRDVSGPLTIWELHGSGESHHQVRVRRSVRAPSRTTDSSRHIEEDEWIEELVDSAAVLDWLEDAVRYPRSIEVAVVSRLADSPPPEARPAHHPRRLPPSGCCAPSTISASSSGRCWTGCRLRSAATPISCATASPRSDGY